MAHKIPPEMNALLEQKAEIEQRLINLEKQIYALEGNYLEDTHHLGNIIRGWDGYLTSRSSGALKKLKFKESDRLFSMSSLTSQRIDPSHSFETSPYTIESTSTSTSNNNNNNNNHHHIGETPSPSDSNDDLPPVSTSSSTSTPGRKRGNPSNSTSEKKGEKKKRGRHKKSGDDESYEG